MSYGNLDSRSLEGDVIAPETGTPVLNTYAGSWRAGIELVLIFGAMKNLVAATCTTAFDSIASSRPSRSLHN